MPRIAISNTDVLIAVDLQNDFCPGGSLSVPRGHEVVPLINRLANHFIDVNGSMKATHESFRTLGIVTTTTAALR
jgi:nicotinamidase-related amidase